MKKILLVLLMLLTMVGCSKTDDPPIVNVNSTGPAAPVIKCEFCDKELTEDEANVITKDMGSWTAKYYVCDECFDFMYSDMLGEIEEDWSDITNDGAVTPGGVPVQTEAISVTININCDEGIKATLYMNNEKKEESSFGGSITFERFALDQLFRIDLEAQDGYTAAGFDLDTTNLQVTNRSDTSISFKPLKNTTFTIDAKGGVPVEVEAEEEIDPTTVTTSGIPRGSVELDTDKPKIRTTTSSAAYNSFTHSDPYNISYSFLIGRTYYMVRQGEYIKGTITAKGAYKFDKWSYYEAYYVELDHTLGSGWFYFDGDIKFANRIDESDVINIMYTDEEEELDTLDPTKPLDVKAAPKGWEKDTINVTYVCKDCGGDVDLDKVVYYLSSDDEYECTMVATYWCENCQAFVFVKAKLGE